MSEAALAVAEPFQPSVLDEESEVRALARALEFGQGFKLLLARCNQPAQRTRLVGRLRAHLPNLTIQEIQFTRRIPHLLDALQKKIANPAPAALFVSGLEHSLPEAATAHETEFVANLNAARNSFPKAVPCPLVLWVPEYVLAAIARGAPDFFSIRSGAYYFAATPGESVGLVESLTAGDQWQAANLTAEEKRERIEAIESLLAGYRSLPTAERDDRAEARLLTRLAALYDWLGRWEEAEAPCRRALAIYEQALGPEHPHTATSLNNLAYLYASQDRYADAEPLYRRALAIREKALGLEHPATVQTLNNLALLYLNQGRYADAEPLYRRALAICETTLGPEHPDTATSLSNLANVYRSQGRNVEAEALLQRVLAICEKALGPEHPYTATSLNNLAALCHGQGRYAEAEALYRRALAIVEKALGPEHPDVATVLDNYAALLRQTDRASEAMRMEARARRIQEKHARQNPRE